MARLKTIATKSHQRKVYSVTELNFRAKQVLEAELRQIWLEAELSNVTIASSGHWYFTLKDNKSQVSCAMFKGSNRLVQIQPKEGMKVLVRGRVSLYEPRGNYQLIVDQMSLAGEGDLLAKYEALKKKLADEGLFNAELKQSIAPIYRTIGIISSPTGAAVHDVLSAIKRRFPLQRVILYPSLVQGEQAAESIRQQLAIANQRNEVDLLLLVRGGGAIEDLWCFNDEQLARDIVNSHIPIISGVGHEVDFTIADFVADLRAATPTAAAEKSTPDQVQLMQDIRSYKAWFRDTIQRLIQNKSQALDWLRRQLQNPDQIIKHRSQQLTIQINQLTSLINLHIQKKNQNLQQFKLAILSHDPRRQIQSVISRNEQLKQQLIYQIEQTLSAASNEFRQQIIKLDQLSPLKVLSRGYSVTQLNDKVIDDAADINVGDTITSRLYKGKLLSKVIESKEK